LISESRYREIKRSLCKRGLRRLGYVQKNLVTWATMRLFYCLNGTFRVHFFNFYSIVLN